MAIEFKRDKDGKIIAVDSESGEKIGEIEAMGDNVKDKK